MFLVDHLMNSLVPLKFPMQTMYQFHSANSLIYCNIDKVLLDDVRHHVLMVVESVIDL
ncbi:unnamed protein product [Schistosoma margrebowiei]|uniref:Uncharacterized protein n=1 Tax=Schistosoma margrebowiei TaxID=48269 RepID=A0A183LX67_9TREM|nr:unnamed protein product [Schistosoma margrebowiei]